MFSIEACSIPDDALLRRYLKDGNYVDCYTTEISVTVTQSQFITAFYTSLIFKVERTILKWFIAKPSTDRQVQQLAQGSIETFAAWNVEDRTENQLLLADFQGRTRSWLMVAPFVVGDETGMRLYFGSAVLPVSNSGKGSASLGLVFNVLLGFHKIYSELLLLSAKSSLQKQS